VQTTGSTPIFVLAIYATVVTVTLWLMLWRTARDGLDDLGASIVDALGETAARELLDVLARDDADRAALIGRIHERDDTTWLAGLLMDLRVRPRRHPRLRIVAALRRAP
jgi:hypothetical protein